MTTNSNVQTITLRSPSDDLVIAYRKLHSDAEMHRVIDASKKAQSAWQALPVSKRAQYCQKAVDWFTQYKAEVAEEISALIGRPKAYTQGEVNGLKERSEYMINIAEEALVDQEIPAPEGFRRIIRPTAHGTVFVIAPWNYPYLTAINAIIPALMAGNTIILKHATQTVLCAERFVEAFCEAGLPEGVFQLLHLDHEQCRKVIQHPVVNLISFTGSVAGGKAIEQAAAGHFKSVSLELGGKDAAYVRHDADVDNAVASLVEGAFFNNGQSCCGIERIYVHKCLFDSFLEKFITQTKALKIGHALDADTNLGPMVNSDAVQFAQAQIQEACTQGARAHIDADAMLNNSDLPPSARQNYMAPQVLTGVSNKMALMQEENFAPVVGIMPVDSDQQALEYINDSRYGLSASVWSQDQNATLQLADQIDTGTVFMNRCDYLDPALPWSGVKDSGRGCALSHLAYQQLTRPKSIHIKLP